jgi:phage-related minor tail protein
MHLDEIKRQFVEQVKLRAYDDKYIDKKEEREILQLAIQQGVTVDSARAALGQVCEANGYVLESKVLGDIKQTIQVAASNDGKVDEKEFNDAVTLLKLKSNNKLNDVQAKRMIIELIDTDGFKTTSGWFSSWYANVKREVGMA